MHVVPALGHTDAWLPNDTTDSQCLVLGLESAVGAGSNGRPLLNTADSDMMNVDMAVVSPCPGLQVLLVMQLRASLCQAAACSRTGAPALGEAAMLAVQQVLRVALAPILAPTPTGTKATSTACQV